MALAVMVLVMVMLGGLTRLSGSGLSMVEWQPLTVLPPLDEPAWRAVFAKYQASPQHQMVNTGMTLAQFKGIFWLEFVHRLWGRLIGLTFLGPFLVFAGMGRIGPAAARRLTVLFLLGGLQGALGWYMVKSGLVSRPEVSHYRLAAHLLTALLIYGALLWSALDFLAPPATAGDAVLRRGLAVLLGLVCLAMGAGALVAGLRAGLLYNTFPRMGVDWLPAEAVALEPWWRNALDNPVLVQFDHRVLAIAIWTGALALWFWARRRQGPRVPIMLIPTAATLQAGLGIATLLLVVPVALAVIHQAAAFLLFTAVLVALHQSRGITSPWPPASR